MQDQDAHSNLASRLGDRSKASQRELPVIPHKAIHYPSNLERKSLFYLINKRLEQFALTISIVSVLAVFYDFGYNQNGIAQIGLKWLYALTLLIGIVSTVIRYSKKTNRPPFRVLVFDSLSILLFIILIIDQFRILKGVDFFDFFDSTPWYYGAIFLVFIRELAARKLSLSRTYFNPAQLFIISFFAIILLGALLLMLPNASYEGINFLNALFTSTSAVCVTGLVVVDTGSYFTLFGQCIILTLIQIGGLGIMTFASYFSYFFRGGTSYENQLMLSDMSNSNKLGEVFNTLKVPFPALELNDKKGIKFHGIYF